jgi:hypothetical protein
MINHEEKDESELLIKRLNESCMSPEDIKKLTQLVNEHKKKKNEAIIMKGFASTSTDAIMGGSYDVGRDVFEPWHRCTYRIDKKCCGYVNVLSEFDPDNPPLCQNKKAKEHPFTPCPKR